MKINAERLSVAAEKVGLEINTEKTKFVSPNIGREKLKT
jgi:hypothetical protein